MASRRRVSLPRGALAWALFIFSVAALAGGAPRGHRAPFFGVFGPLPLGIPKLGWMGIGLALAAAYWAVQSSRGAFTDSDEDPYSDPPTTLHLDQK